MEDLITNTAIINPIFGGVLIGLASIGLMLFNGRIAGISGILKGIFSFQKGDTLWRITFIAGMILAGIVVQAINPDLTVVEITRSDWAYGIAGLLIGLGAGLANGCTSGHGVCGVGRLSNRSVSITMIFTASGIVTVWAINALLGGVI
jgi:uncharacterized protein